MKVIPDRCPCGANISVIFESVPVKASVQRNDDEYEYAGESEVCWDEQAPIVSEKGKSSGLCANGHVVEVTITGSGGDR